eukprot:11268606-Ditylum_brightwellii.AAC.1
MSNFQNFDFEHGSTDEHKPVKSPAKHLEELTKLRAKMDKYVSEMDARFKARQIEWDNFFSSLLGDLDAVISNDAHQEQQHHDHNAATRIQSIVRLFLQRNLKFDLLVQEPAVIIQSSL